MSSACPFIHIFYSTGWGVNTCVAFVWRDTPPWSMGGRRHPASGGVDGLCNKNTWRELRKRRRLAAEEKRGNNTAFIPFSVVQLLSHRRFLRLNCYGYVFRRCVEGSGWNAMLCVAFLVFLSRQREITVLYPSLADWSESPPYSALPRPGVEPKRTALFMCFSLCLHSRTITWTRGEGRVGGGRGERFSCLKFNIQTILCRRGGDRARMAMLNQITQEDVS